VIAARAPFANNEPDPSIIVSYHIPSRFQSNGNGLWIGARRSGKWGFTGELFSLSNWVVQTPYWFIVVLTTVITIAPWLTTRRFSLRTLLFATTLVAVVLALIVWLR
jgi:hypothetical protein